MKDLALWLGLLSAPAIISVIFGPPGFEAFVASRHAAVPVRVIEEARADYATYCAHCHGRLGEGTARAPGLAVPPPGGETAFRHAVRAGVPPRGPYGSMPPFPGLSAARVDGILAYLRLLSREGATP